MRTDRRFILAYGRGGGVSASLVLGGGGLPSWSGGLPPQRADPPPLNRMIDTCKNITFHHTSDAVSNNSDSVVKV